LSGDRGGGRVAVGSPLNYRGQLAAQLQGWHTCNGIGLGISLMKGSATCMSYEEEDTCMSYEEEDTCM